MPPLDLQGFINPVESFEGLDKASQTLARTQMLQSRLAYQQQGRQAATSKFVEDYYDPKQHLTGTPYDPGIINGFQSLLQQGEALASKGASNSDILMALGPQAARLSQYSDTAKLINDNIKNSVGQLKQYSGYDPESLTQEAKKQAFYGPDGKLKDISTIDPNQDYVSEATKNNPQAVTSSKGLDDFVQKTPMADYTRNVTTTYEGRSQNNKIQAQHPFWMDLKKEENGNVMTDAKGQPLGLGVVTQPILGDDGKPMVDPETKQPYQALDKNYFNAIMSHNPDVADFIRGEVSQHFKAAGAQTTPTEGSPQWMAMARSVLGQELASRDRSHFNVVEQAKETGPAVRVELGGDPAALKKLQEYEEATKLKGDYYVADPNKSKATKTNAVQTVGEIFNNNPSFTQGEPQDIPVNGQNRSVIDVTSAFPQGGLNSGKGSGDKYTSVYYDPNKREMLLGFVPKDKSKGTALTYETIPENQAGRFMARIAGANNVDPAKVPDILTQQGYQNAQFKNAAPNGSLNANLSTAHQANIDATLKSEKYDNLKGTPVQGGVIDKVNDRYIRAFLGAANKFSVDVKAPDGTVTTKYFKDKDDLTNFVKGGNQNAAPKAAVPSGVQWK